MKVMLDSLGCNISVCLVCTSVLYVVFLSFLFLHLSPMKQDCASGVTGEKWQVVTCRSELLMKIGETLQSGGNMQDSHS